MGQKINPIGFRVGINRTWDSRWFADNAEYGRLLLEDMDIREHIMKNQRQAGISKVVIERPHKKCRVTVHAARPGILIGKKGADIEKLRGQLSRLTASEVFLNIVEIRKPEIDATLVAEGIAQQLERRVAFRRAMKRAVQSAMRLGAEGIRINCAGRLGGAEIARTEWYREGRVPLHTLRSNIDYGQAEARTAYGIIGIKVWIFKGEIMEHDPMAQRRDHGARPDGAGAACDSGPGKRRRRKRPPSLDEISMIARCARYISIEATMLQPKKTKFRKAHKGRLKGNAKGGFTLTFGSHGLKAMEPERVTARQIEAARRAMTRKMKRVGRVWIRVFPDLPVSQKPTEVRMGKGKGAPEYWAARVLPGRIMFEIDGVPDDLAREALRLAAAKLPIKTRVVARFGIES